MPTDSACGLYVSSRIRALDMLLKRALRSFMASLDLGGEIALCFFRAGSGRYRGGNRAESKVPGRPYRTLCETVRRGNGSSQVGDTCCTSG